MNVVWIIRYDYLIRYGIMKGYSPDLENFGFDFTIQRFQKRETIV